jgi:hypothetical protein
LILINSGELQNVQNIVELDYILLLYLIIGSEHNADALPKNYKYTTWFFL